MVGRGESARADVSGVMHSWCLYRYNCGFPIPVSPVSDYSQQLQQALALIDLPLTPTQSQKLGGYLALFIKWNKAYNLSAIRDPQEMIHKHLLDSLSIAPHLTGQRFIDVGTGGGLPGIPLAITFPDRHFTLLDSAGKKTRFLFQVKQALALDNVQVENRRVESFTPSERYDGVISRAFASLTDMTQQCHHLLNSGGKFWAMKGVFPEHELSELEKNYIFEHNVPLQVPGVTGERCLIVLGTHNFQ